MTGLLSVRQYCCKYYDNNINMIEYNIRIRGDIYVPTVTTNYSQNNLFHNGHVDYNNLPKGFKDSTTLT